MPVPGKLPGDAHVWSSYVKLQTRATHMRILIPISSIVYKNTRSLLQKKNCSTAVLIMWS